MTAQEYILPVREGEVAGAWAQSGGTGSEPVRCAASGFVRQEIVKLHREGQSIRSTRSVKQEACVGEDRAQEHERNSDWTRRSCIWRIGRVSIWS